MRNQWKASGCMLLVLTFLAAHGALGQDAAARRKLALDKPAPLVLSRQLPPDALLALDVNVGEVNVLRSDDEHVVRVEIDPHHFEDEATVRSWVRQFEVSGTRATIRIKMPKGNNNPGGAIKIYVPRETGLKLDLGVGDLTVAEIEGSKDLHVGIGDLTVKIDDAAQYGDVEGATRIGDVSDQLWAMHASGFLGKTEHRSQEGRYRLRATVDIGDVSFVKPDAL